MKYTKKKYPNFDSVIALFLKDYAIFRKQTKFYVSLFVAFIDFCFLYSTAKN